MIHVLLIALQILSSMPVIEYHTDMPAPAAAAGTGTLLVTGAAPAGIVIAVGQVVTAAADGTARFTLPAQGAEDPAYSFSCDGTVGHVHGTLGVDEFLTAVCG